MLFFLLPIFLGAMIAFQSTCNGLLFPYFGVLGVGFLCLGIAGFFTIFCRMFSYRASQFVTSLEAAFFSSTCGAIVIFIIYMITIRGRFPIGAITAPPAFAYLTGVVAIGACVINNITYKKMSIVHATILLLVGQIVFGIIADRLMLGSFSVGKIIGISVVTAGIFLDKWVSARNARA